MKIIAKGNKRIQHLLKPYCDDGSYKVSNYVFRLNIDKGLLLYSTLTGEMIWLSASERSAFECATYQSISTVQYLAQHRFIIPEKENEAKTINQLRDIFITLDKCRGDIYQYNILPTTACNARCFYCFQSEMPRLNMTKETADELVSFIASHCRNKRVILSWFGGEPTLGIKQIDYICDRLSSLGVSFESKMISNGYLFDDQLISKAKARWKLNDVQITLDGTERVYNETKQYVGALDNPYKRVLNNIESMLAEHIRVNIRLNCDMYNTSDLERLINDLALRFSKQKDLFIYIKLLDEDVGFQPVHHTTLEREQLEYQYNNLQDLLESKGWPQGIQNKLPEFRLYSCMADNQNCIQCTPNGLLSKCEDQVFDHVIGTLQDGIVFNETVDWWRERTVYDDCETCQLYPTCNQLLLNCPIRKNKCNLSLKRRTIDRSYKLMTELYKKYMLENGTDG